LRPLLELLSALRKWLEAVVNSLSTVRTLAIVAVFGSALVGVSPALAQHHGGEWHGGGGWHEGWRGHAWDHDWHRRWHGGVDWDFGFGPWWGPWWDPGWANPYAYYPFNQSYVYAYPAVPAPIAPPPTYWYYCRAKKAYYPYVSSCPEAWQPVPANPPK
jgi:hypothetical protein